MKRAVQMLILVVAVGGLFLFFTSKNSVKISNFAQTLGEISSLKAEKVADLNVDLPPQNQLENPPKIIKAIYATGWSAGSARKSDYLIKLIKDTELNAIVIDIKDYTGKISYDTGIEAVNKYGAEEIRIRKPNELIKKFHDAGIYIIARVAVFQDQILAKSRPDLALGSLATEKQWKDYKGLMWIDPAAKESWDYNIAIVKDALERGFDEINFDYIRFASDGNLDDIKYPFWDEKTLKRYIMRDFFKYLRQSMPDAKLSADLFGLTTINYGDIGIGQNIDDAYHYFDAIAPMLYPSHYNKGFNNHPNPALYPYDVVYTSMQEANKRLSQYLIKAETSTSTEKYLVKRPQLRPWLQDFDLGTAYTADMVRAQIDAVYAATGLCSSDAATSTVAKRSAQVCNSASGDKLGGWMLWDPANNYTKEALLPE